jgi:hypothetical protein
MKHSGLAYLIPGTLVGALVGFCFAGVVLYFCDVYSTREIGIDDLEGIRQFRGSFIVLSIVFGAALGAAAGALVEWIHRNK